MAVLEGIPSLAHDAARVLVVDAEPAPALPVAEQEPVDSAGFAPALEQLPFHFARQLSHAWDLRHIETGAHVRRMAESTRQLALVLGTSDAEASLLGQAAMLHDIGKIAIPDTILTKPGKLSAEELALMQRHAEIGGALLAGSGHPFLDLASVVARSHHERWNGSGYPDRLVGDDCAWQARLVGVVDVFDALGHARCYKEAWSPQRLQAFFEEEAGKLFDPEMVAALLAISPQLEALKSEYPDVVSFDYQSCFRLKLAGPRAPGPRKPRGG